MGSRILFSKTFVMALAAASLLATAAAAQTVPDGATLFKQNCAACHQPMGQGIPGAFPALAGNTFAQGDPKAVAHLLLNGRGGMPNFRDDLTNEEVAAVLTYVRSAWGNKAAPVTVAVVAGAQGGDGATGTDASVLPYH